MKCSVVRKYLVQEWEPSAEVNERVREHLRDCPSCRSEQAAIREAFQMVNELPKMTPGSEFSVAWRSRIREEAAKTDEQRQNPLKTGWLKPVNAFAVVAIAVLGFIGYRYTVTIPKGISMPNIAEKSASSQTDRALALKSEATVEGGLYELKVLEVGPKNKDVQRVIRNFRNSHEEGIVFSNKEENEEWTTFKDLSLKDVNDLRYELESLGAKVKVVRKSE